MGGCGGCGGGHTETVTHVIFPSADPARTVSGVRLSLLLDGGPGHAHPPRPPLGPAPSRHPHRRRPGLRRGRGRRRRRRPAPLLRRLRRPERGVLPGRAAPGRRARHRFPQLRAAGHRRCRDRRRRCPGRRRRRGPHHRAGRRPRGRRRGVLLEPGPSCAAAVGRRRRGQLGPGGGPHRGRPGHRRDPGRRAARRARRSHRRGHGHHRGLRRGVQRRGPHRRGGPGAGRGDRPAHHHHPAPAGVPGRGGRPPAAVRRGPVGGGDLPGAARAGGGHGGVDLRPEPHHRPRPRPRHRLQPVRHLPVPGGAGRGVRAPRGGGPHRAHRREDRRLQRPHRRRLAVRPAGVPPGVPALLRLRRRPRRRPGRLLRRRRPACAVGRPRPPGRRPLPAPPAPEAGRRGALAPGRGDGHASTGPGRHPRHRRPAGARQPVPPHRPGPPRRPGAADLGREPPGERGAPHRLRLAGGRRPLGGGPGHLGGRHRSRARRRHRGLRHRPVAGRRGGAGRCRHRRLPRRPGGAGGTRAHRPVRRRRCHLAVGGALGRAGLARGRGPGRSRPGPGCALRGRGRWPAGPAGRQQGLAVLPAPAGPGAHRPHHLHPPVRDVRERGGADQGAGAQPPEPDRHLRGHGLGLPGRSPLGSAGLHAHGDHRCHHPHPHVLHRLRAVDGLRGVPAVEDQGGARCRT